MNKKYLIPGIITLVIVSALLGAIYLLESYEVSQQPSVTEESEISTIPYEEEVIEDYNLFTDDKPVPVQIGIDGQVEDVYKTTKDKDGNVISREKISSETIVEKQNRIVRQGMLDRVETTDTIKERVNQYFDYMKKGDIANLYPMLSESERMAYSSDQLGYSAQEIGYAIESYAFTQELYFGYPDYLSEYDDSLRGEQTSSSNEDATDTNSEEEQTLIAYIPVSYLFQSPAIGRQEVNIDLIAKRDNDIWNFMYIGPTEVIPVDRQQTRDDGGVTYGNPVGGTIALNNVIIFPSLDVIYIDYLLSNNSSVNYVDDDEEELVIANASIQNVTLYDDPGTTYRLAENVLFQQGESTVFIDQSAVGRLLFQPAPGPQIDQIYLTLQLMVGDYAIDIDFGEIALTRQNRQAEYQAENAID